MAGFSDAPFIQKLAVPSVCVLTAFLSYFSQLVFLLSSLEPGPPRLTETLIFNASLACLWTSYYRTVTVDAGRYIFKDKDQQGPETETETETETLLSGVRWCRKCSAAKPPRAHHCRVCGRCIPKMDHHCPWTGNCVSMTTFPHFLRFLAYANASLWLLGRLLWQRCRALWDARDVPAHLGPPVHELASLALLALIWFFTTVALGLMLATTVRGWVLNQTSIEGWEIERHEALVSRRGGGGGGSDWWDIKGPDGRTMRFERVEFPYDVGVFANMAQAMGTRNLLLWLWPLAAHPRIGKAGRSDVGWVWLENGFNRREGMWPPPHPDKMRRARAEWPLRQRDLEREVRALDLSPEAFRSRQEEDVRRRNLRVAEPEVVDEYLTDQEGLDEEDEEAGLASGPWKSADGDTLADYGVDAEDTDDDVPIAELLRRRRAPLRFDVE